MKSEIEPEKVEQYSSDEAKRTPHSVLRVGIIGAGLMGGWHALAARKAGGSVVAVVDTNQEQALVLARNHPGAQNFANLRQMFDQKSLDVIHICTPTVSHRTIAEFALRNGANLFIEKPLAPTADETIYLYDLAATHGALICPAHQFAFQDGVEKAVKMIPRIGNIIHLEASVCSAGGGGAAAGATNKLLDSIAFDILPHPLSLFQKFLNGNLSEDRWDVSHPQIGELRANGHAGEISLSIFVSMSARPTLNSLEIFGTGGKIHLDLFHGFAVLEKGKVSRARKILHPFDLSVKTFSAAAFNLLWRTARFESAYPGLNALVNSFYQTIRGAGGGGQLAASVSRTRVVNIARVRDFLISRANIN